MNPTRHRSSRSSEAYHDLFQYLNSCVRKIDFDILDECYDEGDCLEQVIGATNPDNFRKQTCVEQSKAGFSPGKGSPRKGPLIYSEQGSPRCDSNDVHIEKLDKAVTKRSYLVKKCSLSDMDNISLGSTPYFIEENSANSESFSDFDFLEDLENIPNLCNIDVNSEEYQERLRCAVACAKRLIFEGTSECDAKITLPKIVRTSLQRPKPHSFAPQVYVSPAARNSREPNNIATKTNNWSDCLLFCCASSN